MSHITIYAGHPLGPQALWAREQQQRVGLAVAITPDQVLPDASTSPLLIIYDAGMRDLDELQKWLVKQTRPVLLQGDSHTLSRFFEDAEQIVLGQYQCFTCQRMTARGSGRCASCTHENVEVEVPLQQPVPAEIPPATPIPTSTPSLLVPLDVYLRLTHEGDAHVVLAKWSTIGKSSQTLRLQGSHLSDLVKQVRQQINNSPGMQRPICWWIDYHSIKEWEGNLVLETGEEREETDLRMFFKEEQATTPSTVLPALPVTKGETFSTQGMQFLSMMLNNTQARLAPAAATPTVGSVPLPM